MKTNIIDMNIHEDNIINICKHLDIETFIYFMCSCKYFFNMRKTYLKFLTEVQKYNNNNFIAELLNSYFNININKDNISKDNMLACATHTDCECECECKAHKIENTLNIFRYYCISNNISELDINEFTKYYCIHEYISEKYFQIICKKNKNFYKIIVLVFQFKWYDTNIDILQLYDIACNIKMKKYNNLYDNLLSFTFNVNNNNYNIRCTFMFLLNLFESNINYKLNYVIIYILYDYYNMIIKNKIFVNGEQIFIPDNEQLPNINMIIEKGYEFINDFNTNKDIKLPNKIKNLILNKIFDVVNELEYIMSRSTLNY